MNKVISCPNCKYEGIAQKSMRGSFWIEVLLWVFFLIPGVIYTIWRYTTIGYKCPQCDFQYVIKKGVASTAPVATVKTDFSWSFPGWLNINPMSKTQFIIFMLVVGVSLFFCLTVIFPALYNKKISPLSTVQVSQQDVELSKPIKTITAQKKELIEKKPLAKLPEIKYASIPQQSADPIPYNEFVITTEKVLDALDHLESVFNTYGSTKIEGRTAYNKLDAEVKKYDRYRTGEWPKSKQSEIIVAIIMAKWSYDVALISGSFDKNETEKKVKEARRLFAEYRKS